MTHLFGKELFIRFTVPVFRERLSIFLCGLLSLLVLRAGCDCINSCSLPFYFLLFNSYQICFNNSMKSADKQCLERKAK